MCAQKNYIKIESADDSKAAAQDTQQGAAPVAEIDPTLVAYQLGSLIQAAKVMDSNTPAILLAGFGSPLKEAVRAIKQAGAESVYVTGTADKERAFTFSGFAKVIDLGEKFDKRLFSNAYSLVEAAKECGARYMLLCDGDAVSELLLQAAAEHDIRVLCPMQGDRSFNNWVLMRPQDPRPVDAEPFQWKKCPHCKLNHEASEVMSDGGTCPTCGGLYRLTSEERIAYLFDPDTFEEWETGLPETDPLGFPGFEELISKNRAKSGREESVRCGKAKLAGMEVALCVMETTFMMGSMGSVAGEKVTRTVEHATAMGLPLVIFSASGGMRMQEGLVSLMQMAKISAAVERHGRAGLPYISVITDPTTGGVTASFATEGDIVVSEPNALIGFAGRRVIEDTIRQTLPEGFQTAEFALEHGLIDAIVDRSDLRSFLAHVLAIHMASVQERKNQENRAATMAALGAEENLGPSATVMKDAEVAHETFGFLPASEDVVDIKIYSHRMVEDNLKDPYSVYAQEGHTMQAIQDAPAAAPTGRKKKGILSGITGLFKKSKTPESEGSAIRRELSKRGVADAPSVKPLADKELRDAQQASEDENAAWDSVLLARNVHRPTAKYYIDHIVDGFIELHGDRAFGDDGAILGGIGWIQGYPVTVIAEEKGEDLNQRIARNFGCPQPEGYRKSLRLMKQAEKFGRPIVCLVDTQGAYCGMEAEERGQGNAIADNLVALSGMDVPVISVVLGEGGSGGALALAVGNKVAMQKHAVYSVLSPEGFASILWKDRSRAAEAAAVMKMSADEACEMGIIEEVLSEGDGPAHENPEQAADQVRNFIVRSLRELSPLTPEQLRNQRYARFRKF
ncbi:acetyl-CoA carboxylase carboxyltransferase subunit alpha [Anaerotardibacter muris]|uniref:acetyl-CoA carboxylase carboxyltransferase subunit alpha n=1 Tax=Anaerotardibacter muris TaxID=2941505 RepID=UPI00203B7D81|nr:acetyl-CoA carboxylase carboxyltransferase subunit alpha [Anaerotardibacter muris]